MEEGLLLSYYSVDIKVENDKFGNSHFEIEEDNGIGCTYYINFSLNIEMKKKLIEFLQQS